MYRKTEIEKEVTGGLKLVKTPDPDGSISCHYLHFDKTEDIHLKSGITTPIPTLKSSGRKLH